MQGMWIMSAFRLTGTVTSVFDQPWSTKDGTRSGVMKKARIALSPFAVNDITVNEPLVLTPGEVVDLLVNVEAAGGFLRAESSGPWPVEADSHGKVLAGASK